jgi:hypothetical protein
MTVDQLIRHLCEAKEIWPEIGAMPVTFNGDPMDLAIPCNPEGQGPVTDAETPVGGIDLTHSGLTAEAFRRHF